MSVPGSEHYVTYKAATAYFAGAVVTAAAVAWNLKGDLGDISKDVGSVRQDVAVIRVELSSINRTAAVETQDVNQAQYLFVKLPPGEQELKDQRIREILSEKRLIRGTN